MGDDEQLRKLIDPRLTTEERVYIYQNLLNILRYENDPPERIAQNILIMLNEHLDEKWEQMKGAVYSGPKGGSFRRIE